MGCGQLPRGATLPPELRAWVEQTRRLVAPSPPFDSAATTRTFTIACADALVLLRPLLKLLRRRAPDAGLQLLTLERLLSKDGLARGQVDLLIRLPPLLPPGDSAEPAYRDPMVCLVRRGHPRIGRRLMLDTCAALPYVDLALFGRVDDTVDRALERLGRTRARRD